MKALRDYVAFSSTGNAADFGDFSSGSNFGREIAGTSSSTRAIFGGSNNSFLGTVIEYITIASTGNGTDFGDLLANNQGMAGTSNKTRGIFAGGTSNVIQYVTIASTGNTTDFGDLTTTEAYVSEGVSVAHGGLS